MTAEIVIANVDRAGDHAMMLGILVVIAAVGGLVYGLIHLVKGRAGPERGRETDRAPEA